MSDTVLRLCPTGFPVLMTPPPPGRHFAPAAFLVLRFRPSCRHCGGEIKFFGFVLVVLPWAKTASSLGYGNSSMAHETFVICR